MNKTEMFRKVEKLIYKRAWHYSRKFNFDFEELKSQAYLIFCEAVDLFDESKKCQFSTFLYHRLRTLQDYYYKQLSNDIDIDDGKLCNINSQNEKKFWDKLIFYQLVDQLSEDGKLVVRGLINGDFEKPKLLRQRKIGSNRIKNILHDQLGWTYKRAEQVYDEIKQWWRINSSELVFG